MRDVSESEPNKMEGLLGNDAVFNEKNGKLYNAVGAEVK